MLHYPATIQQLDVFENSIHVVGESPSVVTKSIEDPKSSHSFYPFFAPQILSKFPTSSAFRLQRVGQWLRAGARYNMDGEDISSALNKEYVNCQVRFWEANIKKFLQIGLYPG
jgi:hypothetical protein